MERRLKKGQTAVEYVLLVAVMTVVFGALFAAMRINLYRLWVCQIGPRVQAPVGCGDNTSNCFKNDIAVPPNCQ
jgi:hypothetical protein